MEEYRIESPIPNVRTSQPDQPSVGNDLQPNDLDLDISRPADSVARRQKHHPEREELPQDNDNETMRWVFLAFLMVWILAAIAIPAVIFWSTRNVLCLSLFASLAPPVYILYRITRYLFPRSKEEYRLEVLRIQHGYKKRILL